MIRYIFVIFFALLTAPASAGYFDGNELYEDCPVNSPSEMVCVGYIAAIADVLQYEPIGRFRACITDRVKISQLRDIVVKYLDDNPQNRHFPAMALVTDAITAAFPCK